MTNNVLETRPRSSYFTQFICYA